MVIFLTGDIQMFQSEKIDIGVMYGKPVLSDLPGINSRLHAINLRAVYYYYDVDSEMLTDMLSGELDIICINTDDLIGYLMPQDEIKIILEISAEGGRTGLCTCSETMEQDTEMLLCFVKVLYDECGENTAVSIVEPDKWMEGYLSKGYDETIIMSYIVPDFQMEALHYTTDD